MKSSSTTATSPGPSLGNPAPRSCGSEKGIVRSYDFANPAQVKETTLKEFVKAIEVPKPVLDALRTAFDAPAVPSPAPAAPK
jgi:hypothetical protein